MGHENRRDFDDADALDPAPRTDAGDHNKSVQQHDWGRGESLEPGGDPQEEPQLPASNQPKHDGK